MNLAKLTDDELLDRYQKLTGKIPCYTIQGDKDRKWHIDFIRGKSMNKSNKYHITNEDSEDTYDTTNDIDEAVKIAHLALSEDYYGGVANVLELSTGMVIKQFTNKDGPTREIPIVEGYTTIWKKATNIQIDRVNKVFDRYLQLSKYLNEYEHFRIAYIETPKLTLGKHTYGPITLDVYLYADLGKQHSWIPKEVRNNAMVLAGLLSEKYHIINWQIGFPCHISLPSHVSPCFKDNTCSCGAKMPETPMDKTAILKITLAIEEPICSHGVKEE